MDKQPTTLFMPLLRQSQNHLHHLQACARSSSPSAVGWDMLLFKATWFQTCTWSTSMSIQTLIPSLNHSAQVWPLSWLHTIGSISLGPHCLHSSLQIQYLTGLHKGRAAVVSDPSLPPLPQENYIAPQASASPFFCHHPSKGNPLREPSFKIVLDFLGWCINIYIYTHMDGLGFYDSFLGAFRASATLHSCQLRRSCRWHRWPRPAGWGIGKVVIPWVQQ